MQITSQCPVCAAATERIETGGEEVWRCTVPDCSRRTYGTGDPDDDDLLPGYTETDGTGAVVVYRGTGEIDVEATAELAAQDDTGDEDDQSDGGTPEPQGLAPAAWEPQVYDVRVKDLVYVLTGAWVWIYGDPEGWRFFTSAAYDPDRGDTTVTITYSDGEVVREEPWPQARLVHAGPGTIPTASRPGPARLVKR
ncbi:hypothetical protein [Streptomyces achromogenes]|uniref:hypothetical protein n=1 Tax=Streptomyces achromogenes TaxID=67255 RepID=UPI003441C336